MKQNPPGHTKLILTIGTTLTVVSVLFYLLFQVVSPFIFIILAAFIISIMLKPVFNYLQKSLSLNTKTAAVFSIIFFVLLIVVPVSIFITLLVGEVSDTIHLMTYNFSFRNELFNILSQNFGRFGFNAEMLEMEFNRNIVGMLRTFLYSLSSIVSQTAGFIINSIFTLVVTYYFLAYREGIKTFLYKINPIKKEYFELLLTRGSEVVVASVRGSILVAGIHSVIGFLGFLIFGVSSPVLLGLLFGVASLIPNIGIGLVWVPVSTYLFLTGNYFASIGLAVWCITANFVNDNFITPKIIGDNTGLHPILVLFGILGGIHAFGLFGIILGPTIIALSFVAIEIFQKLIREQ